MQTHFLSTLNRLASLLKRSRDQVVSPGATEAAPLDPVERLHRSGSTFPVVIEFRRPGW